MKKTRIVTILICITLLIASIFVFSACEMGNFDPNGDNSDTQTVTVSFVVDGSVLTTKTITSGSDITDLPAVPEKTGYNGAWSVSDLTSISTDITVNAVYTAKTYTLTFDYDGADGNNTQISKTVTYNQTIGDLPMPTKDGFTFGGWKIDGNTITETTTWNIDGDKTAVASYIAINDGHSILTADGYTFKDKTLTLKNHLSSDTEEYDLRGKFTVSVGSTWRAYSSSDCQPLNENINRILTLKSGWNVVYIRVENQTNYERSDYELKIYKNSRFTVKYYNGITLIDEESVEEGDCANGITPPDKEYYTFVEWQNNGKSFDVVKTPITENTEIYAKYKANEYKVVFKADGKTVDTKTYTVEKKTVVAPSIPEKTGYTAKWEAYELNCSDITVNAIYTIVTYKVTFKIDGENVETKTYTVENMTVVAPSIPEKTGYTVQWEAYELNCRDITVNAEYTAKTYTLTFDYDGADGNNTQTSKTVTYNQPIGDLPVPVKTNHKFVKWMNGTTEFTSSTIWNIDADSKIVAVWDEIYSEGLEFTLNSKGTAYSVSKGTCIDKNVVIPKIYNELPVTSIGSSAFRGCSSLTNIVIPDSVTSIGRDAFYNCRSLTSITIPNSVTNIGEYAFFYCIRLTSITIPNSVTSIGSSAFEYCYSLTSVTIGSGVKRIGSSAFSGCSSLTSIVIPNSVTSIGDFAFYNCSSLTSIVIPDSVTSVGKWAFYNCSSLTSVNYTGTIDEWVQIDFDNSFSNPLTYAEKLYINDELITEANITTATKVNAYAFNGCISLTSVTIGNSVESIGKRAFFNCYNLTSVTMGNSVESIGDSAFEYCYSLTSVTIGSGVKSIGSSAFSGCSSLTSIVIPDNVKSIGTSAFESCYKLVEVINKSNLNIMKGETGYTYDDENGCVGFYALNIKTSGESDIVNKDDYLFYTYDNVNYLLGYVGSETNLTLPDSYNGENYVIYKYAFSGCSSLTSIVIPNSVTSIGKRAFFNCYNLTSVTMGNSVESIGDSAFEYCYSLTSVTIGSNVTSIGSYAFNGCISLTSIVIPDNVTSIGEYAFEYCDNLTSVNYTGTIDEWVQIEFDGYYSNPLYYAKKLYINNELVTEANITTATKINAYAFYNCDSLTSITIPNSVTSIGENAFNNCESLTSVNYTGTIDEWVQIDFTDEESNPLTYAEKLYINDELITEANITTATKVNAYAFYNCTSLESVTIGDSVESIGKRAFYYCYSLTSVTIGSNVTSIGENAFEYCYKLVEVINKSSLNITKGEWDNGRVGYYALNIKTSGESDIVNKYDYLFYTYNNVNYLLGYVGSETNLTLPDSYNGKGYVINDHAFRRCSSLTIVTIPDCVTYIGEDAFDNCYRLTSVTIGNSVESIGSSAFYDCGSLVSVTIGSNVTSIGEYAFSRCSSLTSVTFENPDGWYTYDGEVDLDLTDISRNATYLKSTYRKYYWYKV